MCQTVCADVDGIGAGASGARSDGSRAVLNSAITKYELLTVKAKPQLRFRPNLN